MTPKRAGTDAYSLRARRAPFWRGVAAMLAAAAIALGVAGPLSAQAPWFRRVVNMLRPAAAPEKIEEKTEGADAEGPPSIILPDNGDLRRKLDQVRQQIEGEHYTEAAGQLGRFLQDAEIRDFFLSRDDERRGESHQSHASCEAERQALARWADGSTLGGRGRPRSRQRLPTIEGPQGTPEAGRRLACP